MYIDAYGSRNDPAIILLAPMMVSGSVLYNRMKPHIKGDDHIIAPDQGGYGKADGYHSADEAFQVLHSFWLEIGCTEIELVYGASLAWQSAIGCSSILRSMLPGPVRWRILACLFCFRFERNLKRTGIRNNLSVLGFALIDDKMVLAAVLDNGNARMPARLKAMDMRQKNNVKKNGIQLQRERRMKYEHVHT